MDEIIKELRVYALSAWRWRWFGLAVAWAVAVVGIGITSLAPNKYEASARIYVDTQSLLGPLLKGIAIEGDPRQQVEVMKRTLLSRPNLAKVARTVDLDLDATTPLQVDQLLQSLLNKTEVKSEGADLFTVSHNDTNPRLARDIVQSLLTIFVESNLGQNREDMETAQSFIDSQLKAYEKQLADADKRIAEFRAANSSVLGEGNFSQRLNAAEANVAQAKLDYEDALTIRNQLRAQASQTPEFVSVESAPQVVVSGNAPTNIGRLRDMEADLDDLLLKYTPQHPDVVALKRQIARTKQLIKKEGDGVLGGQYKSQIPNPVFETIQVKLFDSEAEVQRAERRLDLERDRLEQLKSVAAIAPKIEAELADISRDYDVLMSNYKELLSRRESVRISQAVDVDTDRVKFRVIDPPEIPAKPSGPNRYLFLAMVMVASLGAGMGVSMLRGQLEGAVFVADDLERKFDIPVLGSVTRVKTPVQERVAMRQHFMFVGGALGIILLVGVCMAMVPFINSLHQVSAVAGVAS